MTIFHHQSFDDVPWLSKDLIFFIIILIVYMLTGKLFAKFCFLFFASKIAYPIFTVFNIASMLACFWVLKILLKKYSNGWSCLTKDMLFSRNQLFSSFKVALFFGFIMVSINYLLTPLLFPGLFPKPVFYRISFDIIFPIIIAPITEEIWFRSFFYRGIKKKFGFEAGLIGSTALFLLYHFYSFSSPSIIVFSILITIYYEKSKSLYNCILVHSIANLIVIASSFFAR